MKFVHEELGTHGLYCVTKGNISLRAFLLSSRADFLSENLTSESTLSISLFGCLFAESFACFFCSLRTCPLRSSLEGVFSFDKAFLDKIKVRVL